MTLRTWTPGAISDWSGRPPSVIRVKISTSMPRTASRLETSTTYTFRPPASPVPGCSSGEVWTLSMATRRTCGTAVIGPSWHVNNGKTTNQHSVPTRGWCQVFRASVWSTPGGPTRGGEPPTWFYRQEPPNQIPCQASVTPHEAAGRHDFEAGIWQCGRELLRDIYRVSRVLFLGDNQGWRGDLGECPVLCQGYRGGQRPQRPGNVCPNHGSRLSPAPELHSGLASRRGGLCLEQKSRQGF